jgi:hypothetical protein
MGVITVRIITMAVARSGSDEPDENPVLHDHIRNFQIKCPAKPAACRFHLRGRF